MKEIRTEGLLDVSTDQRLKNMGERSKSFRPDKYKRSKQSFERCPKCRGLVLLPCVLCEPEAFTNVEL